MKALNASSCLVGRIHGLDGLRAAPEDLRVGHTDGLIHPIKKLVSSPPNTHAAVVLDALQATTVALEVTWGRGEHSVEREHREGIGKLRAPCEHRQPFRYLTFRRVSRYRQAYLSILTESMVRGHAVGGPRSV